MSDFRGRAQLTLITTNLPNFLNSVKILFFTYPFGVKFSGQDRFIGKIFFSSDQLQTREGGLSNLPHGRLPLLSWIIDPVLTRTISWPRKWGCFDIPRILDSLDDIYVFTVLCLSCFLWFWCSVWFNIFNFLELSPFISPGISRTFLFWHSQGPHLWSHLVHWFHYVSVVCLPSCFHCLAGIVF